MTDVSLATVHALAPVESAILSISTKSTADHALDVYSRFHAVKAEMKRLDALLEALLIEYIKENGDLVIEYPGGEKKRFYVGVDKKTVCKDPHGVFDAILDATGGDVTRLIECFASNCFKYGAVKNVIGEEKWATLFAVEESDAMKEGSAKKLKTFDSRFMK